MKKSAYALFASVSAVVVAQAEPVNLIRNGGFEESNTAMEPAGYMYVSGDQAPTGWTVGGGFVWLNATGANVWNPGMGYVIEGTYSAALQREGSAWQTVAIPTDGYYELTWRASKRNGMADHTVIVKIDGRDVCAATTVWDYWAHKPFTTGPVWLTQGEHEIGFQGVNDGVNDSTSFIDCIALTAVEVGDVNVTEGTREIGSPPPTGKLTVAKDATVTVSASSRGVLGLFRQIPASAGTWPFEMFANNVYSLSGFQYWTHFDGPSASLFLPGTDGAVFSVGDDFAGTLPDEFKEGGAKGDLWAAEWNAILTIPESGLYTFRASVDDAFIMALDGRNLFQSQDCVTTKVSAYLEKGPHVCYIGLLDNSSKAGLELKVKGPGETEFKGLPLAWFTPMTGPNGLAGAGDIAPADGTALVVAQSPLDDVFAGRLAGTGTGALVVNEKANGSTGKVELSDVTGGVPYLANGELAVTARGRDLESVGSSRNDGLLRLTGVKSVKNLYGGQKTFLGEETVHIDKNLDDGTCGISTEKTYTHLKSFPLSSTDYPTVNGVTFDNRGEMDGTGPYGVFTGGTGTGLKSLFKTFNYGNGTPEDAQYTFVLKGLTPGTAYDFRFYFLGWGVGPDGNGRIGTFTFAGQDINGHAVTFGTVTTECNAAVGGVDGVGVFGCRYVAGADGQFRVTVASANEGDTVHCYAFSNEVLSERNTVTLTPPAGARASLLAELSGTDKVIVDGAGEQVLGGPVTLSHPLDVKGKVILTKGADVRSGVNLRDGTLEVRGGARLAGLSGTGAVDFRWGDRHPFGPLQDDGTFAASPAFRIEHFTCDADSGVTPTKAYLAAFNYWGGASIADPVFDAVNEVGFRRLVPDGGNAIDFRAAHLSMNGVPCAMHTGNQETIGLAADQAFYTVFSSFCYGNPSGQESLPEKTIAINGLSIGETYEVRFYERLWSDAEGSTRQARLAFTNAQGEEEDHVVYIDREAATGPYYIAIRFTATTYSYTVKHCSPDQENTWHLYAATLEKVDDAANRRVLDFAADAEFAGTVTGCGFVEKTGAGRLTLSGAVNAPGCWAVTDGAVLLNGAAATVGTVAVGSRGTFGGVGQVAGDLGVAAGGTLVVGEAGLAVGGTLAIGEGAKIVVNGSGTIRARQVKLPKNLTFQADVGQVKRLRIVSAESIAVAEDRSWTVLKASGETDSGAIVRVGDKTVGVNCGGLAITVR